MMLMDQSRDGIDSRNVAKYQWERLWRAHKPSASLRCTSPRQMSSGDQLIRPVRNIAHAPNEVSNNNNYGSGAFYQANGVQNIYCCPHAVAGSTGDVKQTVEEGAPREEARAVPRTCCVRGLEPYRTTLESLARTRQRLSFLSDRTPSNNTITRLSIEVDNLGPPARCVAKITHNILKVSPAFASLAIFSAIERCAFVCNAFLKELADDLGRFDVPPDVPQALAIFARRWFSLYPSIHKRLCLFQAQMMQFIQTIMASHVLELFDIENGELGEIMSILPRTWDLHHPSVDMIWVRQPVGMNWYAIPLRFCNTWRDLSIVIYQYCQDGPETQYMRRGAWTLISEADNSIIDQTSFPSILKPEMRFDIGVIMQLLAATTECPQCGYGNGQDAIRDGWVRCADLECGNLFRIVFNPKRKPTPMPVRASQEPQLQAIGSSQHLEEDQSKPQHPNTKLRRVLVDVPHPRTTRRVRFSHQELFDKLPAPTRIPHKYKLAVNNFCQGRHMMMVTYKSTKGNGHDHTWTTMPMVHSRALLAHEVVGNTKREAEESAARQIVSSTSCIFESNCLSEVRLRGCHPRDIRELPHASEHSDSPIFEAMYSRASGHAAGAVDSLTKSDPGTSSEIA
ncbi:hypothetical protein AB1N83_010572 [Pleurotus pulmonarius]